MIYDIDELNEKVLELTERQFYLYFPTRYIKTLIYIWENRQAHLNWGFDDCVSERAKIDNRIYSRSSQG